MTAGARPRVVLVLAAPGESRGYPLLERVEFLRGRGWDAHLVYDRDALRDGDLTQLASRVAATAVHGSARRRLRSLVAELEPAVVHFHSAGSALRSAALNGAARSKLVVTLTGQDLNMAGLGRPAYYRALWQAGALLHLPAESLWRRALERGCHPEHRHVVVGPAADTKYFDPASGGPARNGRSPRLRVLSVGPLVWAQGYEHALQAVRILLDGGVDLEYRIVGEGELLPAVAFARRQLGLEDRVGLLAPAGREELRRQLHWADVFLNAAVAEGFTDAAAEAHAVGLPVVTTARGLLDESLRDEAALVVPSRSADALADALALIAAHQELRRRLSECGRACALGAFDLAHQLPSFEELYREASA